MVFPNCHRASSAKKMNTSSFAQSNSMTKDLANDPTVLLWDRNTTFSVVVKSIPSRVVILFSWEKIERNFSLLKESSSMEWIKKIFNKERKGGVRA